MTAHGAHDHGGSHHDAGLPHHGSAHGHATTNGHATAHDHQPAATIGWLDATSGISGDMLLGACVDAGVDVAVLQDAVDALHLPERITLSTEIVRRAGLRAIRVHVTAEASRRVRRLADILDLLAAADLDPQVRRRAVDVFTALATAEAHVHGQPVDAVHFHEVGALDSLADVVGVVTGLHALGLDALYCSPIALGGGRAATEHGSIPVPGPAVLELARAAGAPCLGGPIAAELATPTGVALAVTLADSFGPMPAMHPATIGLGAGGRDPDGHPNVTRLVLGRPLTPPRAAGPGLPPGAAGQSVVIEANVDDLDPRLWPPALAALLEAGAADAWLTPILMKKGRPAHTVSVLCDGARVADLRRVLFAHTTTIGVREHTVGKAALDRRIVTVPVAGGEIRMKVASWHGEVLNASAEYADVLTVAAASGLPPKVVLDAARAACADVYVEAHTGSDAHAHGEPGFETHADAYAETHADAYAEDAPATGAGPSAAAR